MKSVALQEFTQTAAAHKPPTEAETLSRRGLGQRMAGMLGRLSRLAGPNQPTDGMSADSMPADISRPAASDEAALFIGRRVNPVRLSRLSLTSKPPDPTAPRYMPGTLPDMLHVEWLEWQHDSVPQPRTELAMYGADYQALQPTADSFACRLHMFDLADGRQLVQAAPYGKEESHASTFQEDAQWATLLELTGDPQHADRLMRLARLSLGTFDSSGRHFTPVQPLPPRPFGVNIIPILHYASQAEQPISFDLTV